MKALFLKMRIAFVWLCLLLASFGSAYYFDSYQFKNVYLGNILGGVWFLWLLVFYLFYAIITSIASDEGEDVVRTAFNGLVLIPLLIVTLYSTKSEGLEIEDVVVYENTNDQEILIIYQSFWTGITQSNYNWQLSKTTEMKRAYRRLKIINDEDLQKEFENRIKNNEFANSFVYQDDEYRKR